MTRLDRLTVVETALRLLNETGLDGLTLRRIAAELNVKAPALYWHFDSKRALLDEMATAVVRDLARDIEAVPDPDERPATEGDWQELLAGAMRGLRRTLLSYRDGARMFSGTTFTGTAYADALQRPLAFLTGRGFTLPRAGRAMITAYNYTIGHVIEEQAVYPVSGERDDRYDVAERAARLGSEYPLAAGIGEELFDNHDEGFETGLAVVIAGIEATLAPGANREPKPIGRV